MSNRGTRPSRYKERFEEAIRLRNEGRLAEAKVVLRDLVSDAGRSPEAALVLGELHLKEEGYEEAVEVFTALSREHPKSEKASLGLFHSLLGLERMEEAVAELNRFLGESESLEYRRLRREFERTGSIPKRPRPTS